MRGARREVAPVKGRKREEGEQGSEDERGWTSSPTSAPTPFAFNVFNQNEVAFNNFNQNEVASLYMIYSDVAQGIFSY